MNNAWHFTNIQAHQATTERLPFWVENGLKTVGESVCDVKARRRELRVVSAGVGAVCARLLELCLWVGIVEVPAGMRGSRAGCAGCRRGARGRRGTTPRGPRRA